MADRDDKKSATREALKAPRLPRVPLVLDLTDDSLRQSSAPPSSRPLAIEGYSARPTPPPSAHGLTVRQRGGGTKRWPPEKRDAGGRDPATPASKRKLRGDAWVEPTEAVDESLLASSVRAMVEVPEGKRSDATSEREPSSSKR